MNSRAVLRAFGRRAPVPCRPRLLPASLRPSRGGEEAWGAGAPFPERAADAPASGRTAGLGQGTRLRLESPWPRPRAAPSAGRGECTSQGHRGKAREQLVPLLDTGGQATRQWHSHMGGSGDSPFPMGEDGREGPEALTARWGLRPHDRITSRRPRSGSNV